MYQQVKLDELCVHKIETISSDENGLIDYFDIASVDNTKKKIISHQSLKIEEAPSRAKQIVQLNDILVSTVRPNLNAVTIIDNETKNKMVASTGFCVLRASEKIEPRYLFYFVQSPTFINSMTAQATGASYPAVSNSIVKSSHIPLPDLPTQRRIADTLDKVSEGITLCRKMRDELDLMVKAKFVEMFGALGEDKFNWGMTTLGVCCELNPKRPRDIPDDMDVSFVAMPSVTEKGQIDTSVIKPYSEVRKGFTYFAENDVLFAKITPCMENGKGCVAKGLTNAIGAGSTEFHVLRPIRGKSNPYWLYYLTVIPGFRENARKVMTGTGGQLRVPITYLDNLPVLLPPIELQEQFATFVSKIDKSRLTIQQVLSKMEMVKLALMQEYFGYKCFKEAIGNVGCYAGNSSYKN